MAREKNPPGGPDLRPGPPAINKSKTTIFSPIFIPQNEEKFVDLTFRLNEIGIYSLANYFASSEFPGALRLSGIPEKKKSLYFYEGNNLMPLKFNDAFKFNFKNVNLRLDPFFQRQHNEKKSTISKNVHKNLPGHKIHEKNLRPTQILRASISEIFLPFRPISGPFFQRKKGEFFPLPGPFSERKRTGFPRTPSESGEISEEEKVSKSKERPSPQIPLESEGTRNLFFPSGPRSLIGAPEKDVRAAYNLREI